MSIDVWLTAGVKTAGWLAIDNVWLFGAVVVKLISHIGKSPASSSGPFLLSTAVIVAHGTFSASGLGRRNHDFLRRNIAVLNSNLHSKTRLVKRDRRHIVVFKDCLGAHGSINLDH